MSCDVDISNHVQGPLIDCFDAGISLRQSIVCCDLPSQVMLHSLLHGLRQQSRRRRRQTTMYCTLQAVSDS